MTTNPNTRRKNRERRKNSAGAWVLGAAIPKDRRKPGYRRRSSK